MDMNELQDIINDIKIHPESFNFDDMNKEIKEMQFKMYCKQAVYRNISNWIKNNPHHTFPKKKRRWINTIRSHRNLICVKYDCDVKELLLAMKNNTPIPDYLKGLSYYVYDVIQYKEDSRKILSNNDKFIIVYANEYEAYQNLFDCGILYTELPYLRVHIRKYSLLDHGFKKLKMKRELENDNKETSIICNNNTKRKCILAKPTFSC